MSIHEEADHIANSRLGASDDPETEYDYENATNKFLDDLQWVIDTARHLYTHEDVRTSEQLMAIRMVLEAVTEQIELVEG